MPLPADLAQEAAVIVGFFEHGASNQRSGFSGQEELLVGLMQWNWSSGSLVTDFVAAVARCRCAAGAGGGALRAWKY